jgi:hypothetical protein
MLRLAVSRPVCLGTKHSFRTYDQTFITVRQLRVCWCGAPSLTIGRVWILQCNSKSKSKSHCDWRSVSHSVSLGVELHLGLMTRYLLPFDSYGLVFCRTPSLTRGRVCLLSMLRLRLSVVSWSLESIGVQTRAPGHAVVPPYQLTSPLVCYYKVTQSSGCRLLLSEGIMKKIYIGILYR